MPGLDVLGVLQEGEIHIKSSQRCLLRPDGQRSDRIFGDILVCVDLSFRSSLMCVKVTRSPCKLPTDVQKVFITFFTMLLNYNGIIFSGQSSI
jgi:RNA-dependent RNA polymerase